ncbi:homocysteine S-methyltransferase [Lentzea sp. NBRC 105346]|uniref:homocysteine S-methyltransferase n=1 Tax=Lentzea sp. NBRC 105346 TaxID=3032205 RepID=UPI0024A0A030|nr:homocysteine S-methyltransferase [Lentzea sp. NBRC 105346]GLZ28551.1 homocysteine S-methyltransferase [Lentzea sp. NBRC 105346]
MRISDGGLATELERRGHDLSDPLWSARLLRDAPDEIVQTHRAFFCAGASIATTASYQASFEGLGRDTKMLLRRSVELARTARDEEAPGGWVAASVGPYGAMLADGSEYRGRYGLSVRELTRWHRPRIEILADEGPDVLAVETVPDIDEAEAVVASLGGVRAWLSFTIDGDRTRAGQPLAEAFALAEAPEVIAIGVNCCAPEDVSTAIAIARATTDKPVIVYPNSGEEWTGRWVGRSHFRAAQAKQWADEGASIIGGCCRVYPDDIAAISRAVSGTPAPEGSDT